MERDPADMSREEHEYWESKCEEKEPPMAGEVKCPNCGEVFATSQLDDGLIPYHDYPRPCRACCAGSKQAPRDINDQRPLWKDEQ